MSNLKSCKFQDLLVCKHADTHKNNMQKNKAIYKRFLTAISLKTSLINKWWKQNRSEHEHDGKKHWWDNNG